MCVCACACAYVCGREKVCMCDGERLSSAAHRFSNNGCDGYSGGVELQLQLFLRVTVAANNAESLLQLVHRHRGAVAAVVYWWSFSSSCWNNIVFHTVFVVMKIKCKVCKDRNT